MFTLLSFIDPDRFNDRAEFDAKYAHLQKSGEAEDVTSLQKVIQPYFYRRMKGDVEKTLPKREETLIEVEMTSLQKQSDTLGAHAHSIGRFSVNAVCACMC